MNPKPWTLNPEP